MDDKATEKRIEKLENDVAELYDKTTASAVTEAAINEKLNSMLITLSEVKSGLSKLQEQPARRWDTLISSALAALATALIGYLIGQII
jgi:septation ring formation regulator EzrA